MITLSSAHPKLLPLGNIPHCREREAGLLPPKVSIVKVCIVLQHYMDKADGQLWYDHPHIFMHSKYN